MQDYQGSDRRRSRRFPYREDILIAGAKQCTCSDISEGGIFISAIQAFEEGEMLSVSIPVNGQRLTVKGEVKYLQHGIGMGIAFRELSSEQKTKIKELVARVSSDWLA